MKLNLKKVELKVLSLDDKSLPINATNDVVGGGVSGVGTYTESNYTTMSSPSRCVNCNPGQPGQPGQQGAPG